MTKTPPITHLVTHSGSFHADDVFSYAILSDLHAATLADDHLVRTRDEDLIKKLAPNAITFDVGREYNPAKRQFDHHQPGAPVREDGLAYAAFGLVWKEYGQQWLTQCAGVPEKHAAGVHAEMEKGMVRQTDMVDVGATEKSYPMQSSLSGLVDRYNPPSINPDGTPHVATQEETDKAFLQAAAIIKQAAHQEARHLHLEEVGKHLVLNEFREQGARHGNRHPDILVLDSNIPWEKTVTEHPDLQAIKLVVSPNSSGKDWGVSCARKTMDSFESRRLLPEQWRGLVNADLEKASGVPGATFCHTVGFYAATTDKNAALTFARRACTLSRQQESIAQTPPPAPKAVKRDKSDRFLEL